MQPFWQIRLFGTLSLIRDELTITRFSTQKVAALLAYLAFFGETAHSREVLAEMFWVEKSGDAARLSLRVALNSLRRQLEPPSVDPGSVIFGDRTQIRLNPRAFVTDVNLFETALKAADSKRASLEGQEIKMREAVELYQGDLLPGRYEDWIQPERERLSRLCSQALSWLSERCFSLGNLTESVAFAIRAAALAPFEEELQNRLLERYIASRRVPEAVAQYHAWERTLLSSFDTTPSKTTLELIQPFLTERFVLASPPLYNSPEANQAVSPVDAPPLRRVDSAELFFQGSTLPAPLTRFFGREREILSLVERLSMTAEASAKRGSNRLISLCGVGGAGKSRLALEAGDRLATITGRQSVFVPLADLLEGSQIPGAILRALAIKDSPRNEPLEAIVQELKSKSLVLILDNFEHLLSNEAQVRNPACLIVGELLTRLPGISCLVTSRQPLNLEGEFVFPVSPLPSPSLGLTLEELAQFDVVRLYLDRTQMVRPDFQLTARNAEAVTKLCARLDCLPLAIELAAANASSLTPLQSLERLASRQDFLKSRFQNKSDRHRSLHAAISWSMERLSPELQRFCHRLSVFRGGWSLESAIEVCEESKASETLSELLEKSLIQFEETPSGTRFRMLETIRQFCNDQLEDEERDALRRRHLEYFTRLVETLSLESQGAKQPDILDQIEKEVPNLRVAMERSLQESAASSGSPRSFAWRLGASLWEFWIIRGTIDEGRKFLEEALGSSDSDSLDPAFGEALNGAGAMAQTAGDYEEARRFYSASLTQRKTLGDRKGEAAALNNLGLIAELTFDYPLATSLNERSLEIRREIDDTRGIANSLNNLGIVHQQAGSYHLARAMYEESLQIKTRLGEKRQIAHSRNNLGNICHVLEDYESSRLHHLESLAIRRELGDQSGVAASLNNLAMALESMGDREEACALYLESVALKREYGDSVGVGKTLVNAGKAFCLTGDWERARENLCEATDILEKLGSSFDTLSLLLGWLRLEEKRSRFERVAVLLGIFDKIRERSKVTLYPKDSEERERIFTRSQRELGRDPFACFYSEGENTPPDESFKTMKRD